MNLEIVGGETQRRGTELEAMDDDVDDDDVALDGRVRRPGV